MSVTFSAATGTLENNFRWLTTEDSELNVSNTNFYGIMEMLGYRDPGCCGRFAGETLKTLNHVVDVAVRMLAINPAVDAGDHGVVMQLTDCMTIIHCGRRPGYFLDRLTALQAIIDIALQNDGFVTYG